MNRWLAVGLGALLAVFIAGGLYGYLRLRDRTYGLKEEDEGPSPLAVTVSEEQGALLTGRVISADDGAPISGAVVELYNDLCPPLTGRRMKPRYVAQTLTDASGAYTMGPVPSGLYRLARRATPGSADAREDSYPHLQLRAGETRVAPTLTAQRGITCVGHIVDALGNPLPNARVRGTSHACGHRSDIGYQVQATDESGKFTLYDLSACTFALKADAPSFVPTLVDMGPDGKKLKAGRGFAGVTITLESGLRVDGQVINGNGRPLPDMVIGKLFEQAVTDRDGRFTLDAVLPGTQELWVATYDYALSVPVLFDTNKIDVKRDMPGIVIQVDYPLPEDYTSPDYTTGFIFDSLGMPMPRREVSCAGPGGGTSTARTNQQGFFALATAPGAPVTIEMKGGTDSFDGCGPYRFPDITPGSKDNRLVVEMPPMIEVQVVSEHDGAPIEHFQWARHKERFREFYDPEGRFLVERGCNPEIFLHVRCDGFVSQDVNLYQHAPDTPSRIVVRLVRPSA